MHPMQRLTIALTLAVVIALIAGCADERPSPTAPDAGKAGGGQMVVANRASGTISVIAARTGDVTGTYALPQGAGDALPEPMYVNAVSPMQRVFVGDRANDRVAVFDARTFDIVGTVPAGAGVFHQWVNRNGRQLWVNNDVDNTISVIDARRLEATATIDVPADLVAMGGKPHDVVLDPQERWGYVTVLGLAGPNDYVVQFDAATYEEVNRRAVGKDPHVKIGANSGLYVAAQNSDQVLVLDPASLAVVADIAVPGAHGVAMDPGGRFFYTTNLPGGGTDAIYTISTRTHEVVGEPVDTPYPVPHNLAVDRGATRMFVTHSGGASDRVTIFDLVGPHRMPRYAGEVAVGLNPFGIGFVD